MPLIKSIHAVHQFHVIVCKLHVSFGCMKWGRDARIDWYPGSGLEGGQIRPFLFPMVPLRPCEDHSDFV